MRRPRPTILQRSGSATSRVPTAGMVRSARPWPVIARVIPWGSPSRSTRSLAGRGPPRRCTPLFPPQMALHRPSRRPPARHRPARRLLALPRELPTAGVLPIRRPAPVPRRVPPRRRRRRPPRRQAEELSRRPGPVWAPRQQNPRQYRRRFGRRIRYRVSPMRAGRNRGRSHRGPVRRYIRLALRRRLHRQSTDNEAALRTTPAIPRVVLMTPGTDRRRDATSSVPRQAE